jgi:hypothetical protein
MGRARFLIVLFIAVAAAGCACGIKFPSSPVSQSDTARGKQAAYDTSGDGKADYFTYSDSSGRVTVIAYDYNDDGEPDSFVNLGSLPVGRCRHFVIILDGVPYDVVKEFYDAGHLRMFYPPSRVIAPFPAMTDLAIEDALGYIPCPSMEASYYNRRDGGMTNGAWDYLHAKNAPADGLLTYRTWTIMDTAAYFSPWQVFKHEIHGAKAAFDRRDRQDVLAYFVGSAGMGTLNGKEGHVRCLEMVERMVNQITWESRGMVKFTIFADHGHTYTKEERLDMSRLLEKKGWHPAQRLRDKKDFVQIEFGIVTYAAFYTHDAPGLAADLAKIDGVELAAYHADGKVFVNAKGGNAVISENNGRFKYEPVGGDPLQLNDIIANLKAAGKVDENGFIDDRALFEATATHVYPDPLRRLWRAFYALVENVPDVVVSLEDKWYGGSPGYNLVVKIASTHGGLNHKNSVTFVMSTVGPLPPLMRSEEISKNLSAILGRQFPPCNGRKP